MLVREGTDHALSELRQPRYAGEGFAADGRFVRDPAPPRVPLVQFPLHDLRARAAARTRGDQAQRPARAIRSRQAAALGPDRTAQAAGRARAHRSGGLQDRARAREPGRERSLVRGGGRGGHGGAAPARRRGLCPLRLGLSQFPRSQGFRSRAGRALQRGRRQADGAGEKVKLLKDRRSLSAEERAKLARLRETIARSIDRGGSYSDEEVAADIKRAHSKAEREGR